MRTKHIEFQAYLGFGTLCSTARVGGTDCRIADLAVGVLKRTERVKPEPALYLILPPFQFVRPGHQGRLLCQRGSRKQKHHRRALW